MINNIFITEDQKYSCETGTAALAGETVPPNEDNYLQK
jgi:hypothetical protein